MPERATSELGGDGNLPDPLAPKSLFTCSGNRVKRVERFSTYAIHALLARDKNCPVQQSTTSRIRQGSRHEKTPSVVRFKNNKKL